MVEDYELLRRYVEERSEEAFAELVRRYLNLVYSSALRQVSGDAHMAEDVSQTVFVDLARKAASLTKRNDLTGWFYTSTHFAASKARRTEYRRHVREGESHAMNSLLENPVTENEWEKLSPVIDDVMLELESEDREAILLRYFENRPFAELGAKFGLKENAARMRVDRALDKLRGLLFKRGITPGVTSLATTLVNKAVGTAPSGLGAKIIAAALVPVVSGGAGLALLNFMTTSTLKKAAVVLVIAATTGSAVHYGREAKATRTELAMENEKLTTTAAELEQTQEENARLKKLEIAADELSRLRNEHAELLKLRSEVGGLRVIAGARMKVPNPSIVNPSGETRTVETPGQPPRPDPKTLYELARVGQINGFKGLLDTYPEMASMGSGPYSSTPLHTAAYHRNMEHLEELLKHNANVNMQNEMGFTPMHDAITGDGKPGGKEVVERLIKSGASLTIKNLSGQTPLAYAIFKNQEDIAEVIRAAGGKE